MRTELQSINDHARLDQWKRLIQECRNSGMSVRSWCKQNNVSEPSYYYYLKKIRQSIVDSETQTFVPLVMNHEEAKSSEIIEIRKGDIHIQVPCNIDLTILMNILKVLVC